MTRKSKPKSSCALCKPHKRWGNSKHRDKPSVRRAKDATAIIRVMGGRA